MTGQPLLHSTRCAICQVEGNAVELFPANFREEELNPVIFSARRLPDHVHYRLVRCSTCGLVRSDPAASAEFLASLYGSSSFTYWRELPSLRRTYGRYLRSLESLGSQKGRLLEIGCGNGFFLEEALAQGYVQVRGVEPGRAAVESAGPSLQGRITCDVMRPGLFPPAYFDVICMFQVLDHMPDPASLLDECHRLLAPGGLVLCLNHDVSSWSARLLGERSPIIDIEHTTLFSPQTISTLFARHGFSTLKVGPAWNRVSLAYLVHLLPLPGRFKDFLLGLCKASRLGNVTVWVPLGNLVMVARRRESPA